MFGYDYVNLNATQIETRRKLLDEAGFQAYITPIIILVGIWASPKVTGAQSKNDGHASAWSRRLRWTLNNTYMQEFGPLQVQILGILYAAFLVFRTAHQTGNDYMHVTKAFGHVAVSQLPLQYMLAMKYPNSPITLATGLTHERLNAYHRLAGRIIHALIASHAVLYLRFFAVKGLLTKRIMDWDVRLGVMAFWTMNFLGILAIPPIRRQVYHAVFYRSHVILTAILPVVLWFHVPYTRIYVAQAILFALANGILRGGASQPATVTYEEAGKDIVRVRAKVGGKHLYPYLPGVHVYLNQPGIGPRTPFTVLSARALGNSEKESEIELIAKNSYGPMTGALADATKHNQKLKLSLEGPYGEAQVYMPELLDEENARRGCFLVVAGGVGATYALPIYKALVKIRGSTNDMRLLWLVRKEEDIEWAKDFLLDSNFASGMHVFITQPEKPDTLSVSGQPASLGGLSAGHPDWEDQVSALFGPKSSAASEKHLASPVRIMVCGPLGLSRRLRQAVSEYAIVEGQDVMWYEEQFGFGGS